MKMHPMSLAFVLLLCVFSGRHARGQFEIQVKYNGRVNNSYGQYSDTELFSHHYANIPSGGIDGHLFQPVPANACSYIDPPPATFDNSSWFALVDDYPACPLDMVTYVRNAGYKLIITSSIDDSHRDVTNEVSNTQFPIVIVTEGYADYLRDNVTSESDEDPVTVHVEGDIILSVIAVTFSFVMGLTCCCCCCCCLLLCLRFLRNPEDFERRLVHIEERRRNFERLHQRERMARQELIESILRQLQELQLDLRFQVPLGAEETRMLPTKEYHAGKEVSDTCAICVEDFVEGEEVRMLPCGHVFHLPCIDEWLGHHSSLCPLCKKEVSRQRGPSNAPGDRELDEFPISTPEGEEESLSSSSNGEQRQLIPPEDDEQSYGTV